MKRLAAALAAGVLLWACVAEARDVQGHCRRLLGTRPGTIVVAEAATGRLIALVNPGLADAPLPPGSAFKPVTALAAIAAGLGPAERLVCRGAHGRGLSCWKPGGHGALTLEEAIAQSCNVAFYQLGERVGPRAVTAQAAACGLGTAPGRLRPAPPEAAATLAVGEGPYVAVTARQLAGLMGAFATDGRLRRVGWTPGAPGAMVGPEGAVARVRRGLRLAVQTGSARAAGSPGRLVAGKTGTATYMDGTHRTYGWFAGYTSRHVVVVMLKNADGFRGAAPVARDVFEALDE